MWMLLADETEYPSLTRAFIIEVTTVVFPDFLKPYTPIIFIKIKKVLSL